MKHRWKKAALAAVLLVIIVSAVMAVLLFCSQRKTEELSVLPDALPFPPESAADVSALPPTLVPQEISCGYAVLEMFSDFCGQSVTEESLYQHYGKVVTSTGRSFEKEMNKLFPSYHTDMHANVTAAELIRLSYQSLKNGIPVPFEWAALSGENWTLHYSLLVGMSPSKKQVTVYNPYGLIETLSFEDWIKRTSFDAYENMPLFLKMGFAVGIFERNTVFVAVPSTETV